MEVTEIRKLVHMFQRLVYCRSKVTMQKSTKERDAHLDSGHISKYLQNEWKKLFTKQLYCIGKDTRRRDAAKHINR